jgi:hypothetical protein
MALSMGGNLVYEGMLDKETDSKVKIVLALGTPFRGSPLFCEEWMQYSIYKNPCFPWTRLDHSLAYKLYFGRNPNLLKDLRWDDADQSIPDVGHFKSRLPLGPSGELTVANTINNRLRKVESETFDKKKIIAYSCYLPNRYMLPNERRYVENTLMMPYTLFTTKVPAHLGREHPVLKMLNKQITSTVPSKIAEDRGGTPFIYQLNDGITPVLSALFVPDKLVENDGLAREADLPKLKDQLDVRVARVFKNSDHLTFIDGYHPLNTTSAVKDELNPAEGSKTIFDWMLYDLLHTTDDSNALAGDNKPNAIPVTAD